MNHAPANGRQADDDIPPPLSGRFLEVLLNGDVRGVFNFIGCPKDTDERG